MRHSPTNEKGWIVEVKVLDVEKRKAKEHSTSKNFYEYVLKVKWSDENQYCVFRRYSMFFDLQAGLRQLFQQKQNIIIPDLPVARLAQAGGVLFASLAKKQCKHIDEFCQKVIQLPPVVSQSDIVLQFFSQWGTDALLSKPISPPSPPTSTGKDEEQIVEKYRSVAQFNGSVRGEMSLRESEVVTVIEKNHTGWWLVANLKGEHGFAPATFLEPVEGSRHVREEEWREVEDDDRMWIAVESYIAQCDDELSYQAGDDVEVLATSNLGWWKIRIKGAIGLTPGSNLAPKPTANEVSYSYVTAERKRRSSYSSISGGIYASIRSPPPRREPSLTRAEEKSKRKAHVSRSASTPHALEYATVEIVSPSPTRTSPQFDFGISDNGPEYATVIPKHLRAKPRSRSMSETDSALKSSLKLKPRGSPDPPRSPPAAVSRLLSSGSIDDETDPGYTSVRHVRSFRTLSPEDDEITRIRSRKSQNATSFNPLSDTIGQYYVAITNFSPPSDRPEDLALTTGETVRLLAEDGVWAFVSTVDPAKRRGWVPSSLLKIKGGGELPASRRSLSVGDITDAIQQEDTAAQSTLHKKAPISSPRNGLEVKKLPMNVVPSPLGEAPPLPGVQSDPLQKASATIKAYFFALEDFTTGDQNCISVRKGEIGQLLEVTPTGWWKMNVQGVIGWTPGDFWSLLQEDDSSKSDDGDELSFYGKLSRSKCEEIMMKNSRELDYLIRESAQKFASFVLSVKYGGKIRHFPIEVTPSGRYVIGRHAFSGLTEIVSFYKTHALFYTPAKEPVSLGQPFRGP